jgi:hypothetical protein
VILACAAIASRPTPSLNVPLGFSLPGTFVSNVRDEVCVPVTLATSSAPFGNSISTSYLSSNPVSTHFHTSHTRRLSEGARLFFASLFFGAFVLDWFRRDIIDAGVDSTFEISSASFLRFASLGICEETSVFFGVAASSSRAQLGMFS